MKSIPVNPKIDTPAYFVTHKTGVRVPIFRQLYEDTAKNLAYAEKRRKIGEEMTEKLGVTCFG